jgi:hypothetical protein
MTKSVLAYERILIAEKKDLTPDFGESLYILPGKGIQ